MNEPVEGPSYPLLESAGVTIRGGLTEALQPGGITLFLLFLIALFYATRLGILRQTALIFLSVAMLFKIAFLVGIFDSFLSWDFINGFWDTGYLLIIGTFLFLGLLLFYDWLVFRRGEDFAALKISPPRDGGKRQKLPLWGKGLVILLAALAVVIQVSWPPDAETTYRIFSAIHYERWGMLSFLLALYAGAFVLPLAVLLQVWQYALAAQPKGIFYAHWSKCLIVSSALFIGYGLSMLWYFIPF